eukprot:1734285-Heterocapsa_arctica.AAC.1
MESHDRKLSHCRRSTHSGVAPNIPVFLASAVSSKKSGLIDLSDQFLIGKGTRVPEIIKSRQIYVGEATVKAGRRSSTNRKLFM